MLAVNAAMVGLVADAVTTTHAGDVAVEEDSIFQKLILICLTPDVGCVAVGDAVHRMEIDL